MGVRAAITIVIFLKTLLFMSDGKSDILLQRFAQSVDS